MGNDNEHPSRFISALEEAWEAGADFVGNTYHIGELTDEDIGRAFHEWYREEWGNG